MKYKFVQENGWMYRSRIFVNGLNGVKGLDAKVVSFDSECIGGISSVLVCLTCFVLRSNWCNAFSHLCVNAF